MTDVRTLLRHAELDAERSSALIRLVLFLALAAVVFFSADGQASGILAPAVAVTLYGIATAAGLILAWRRIFSPLIPYVFVTFDVVLVAAQILILSRLMGMQSTTFAIPAAGLIFVILIHASMRYRPWLVVYAAFLFVASVETGTLLVADGRQASPAMGGMATAHASMAGLLNFQVLPVLLVALAAFILLVIGHRTRGLLLRSIEHATRTTRLSRYFSPNLAAKLVEGDDQQLLAGRRQLAAVLFVDIRGFTALGESMTPHELVGFLTEYRERLTRPVFLEDGTVDKFIGDAIMAVFGSPIPKEDDAARALRCARGILDAAASWSSERERVGDAPVAIGVGVHYGEVFAGALGGGQLMEYTVIGDTVNVAERLERLSRSVGSSLVVSAALLEAADESREGAKWRRLPPQELKGHQRRVEAFCLA